VATTTITPVQADRSVLRNPLALWHLFSLDAPTVAALWFALFSRVFHADVLIVPAVALAVAVWILYAADRLSDAHRNDSILKARHYFHAAHRHEFLFAIAFAFPVLGALLVRMPAPLRMAWMLMGIPLVLYAAAVHIFRWRIYKEILVGIFFSTTIAMPAFLVDHSASLLLSAILFGMLCWLNCVVIARAEDAPAHDMDALTAWSTQHLRTVAATLTIAALIGAFALPNARAVLLPIAFSSALFLLLDTKAAHLSAVTTRALADAVLLTPLLALALLHTLR